MTFISFISLILILITLVISACLLRALAAKKWLTASRRLLYLIICFGTLAFIMLLFLYLHSYRQLTWEAQVAQLSVTKMTDQRYTVSLDTTAESSVYILTGDEWQLDARVIKWKPWAVLSGAQARYRLERLSSRYRDIEQANTLAPTVIALSDDQFDAWLAKTIGDYRRWLPWVDTYFGNAVYFPLADGAQYQVSISQTGLIARPVNEQATKAINNW